MVDRVSKAVDVRDGCTTHEAGWLHDGFHDNLSIQEDLVGGRQRS